MISDLEFAFIEKSIRVFLKFLKFIFIYYIFTMTAFAVTMFSYMALAVDAHGIRWFFTNYPFFETSGTVGLFSSLYNELWAYAPLNNFFEENLGGLGNFLDILQGIFFGALNPSPQSATAFFANLIPDTAKISLATLLVFVFSRANKLLLLSTNTLKTPVGAFFGKIIDATTFILWSMAGFSLSTMIVELIMRKVTDCYSILAFIIGFSLLLHIILLSLNKGVDGRRPPWVLCVVILVLDFAFGYLNSCMLWLIAFCAAFFGELTGYALSVLASIIFLILLYAQLLITNALCHVSIFLNTKISSVISRFFKHAV